MIASILPPTSPAAIVTNGGRTSWYSSCKWGRVWLAPTNQTANQTTGGGGGWVGEGGREETRQFPVFNWNRTVFIQSNNQWSGHSTRSMLAPSLGRSAHQSTSPNQPNDEFQTQFNSGLSVIWWIYSFISDVMFIPMIDGYYLIGWAGLPPGDSFGGILRAPRSCSVSNGRHQIGNVGRLPPIFIS